MKGKHLHEPHLFVCVSRLLFPALIFSGPGFCLLYPLCIDEVPEGTRGTECLPLFCSLLHNLLIISNYGLPFSLFRHANLKSKGAVPLAVGDRKLSFLDVLLLVSGPTGKLYVSH